jgi:uncharacterized membrane protein
MTPSLRARRTYIDWMRGAAVVIMIFAHTMDSWTRRPDKDTWIYGYVVKVAGMGAPLFLFLAGLAVALAAGAKMRKGATRHEAGAAVRRRGWEILGLAFLFRLQAWVVSPGSSAAGMLKVDILNIMGPAMVLAAWLWSVTSRTWLRLVVLAAVASAFSLLTPLVRASTLLAPLPDWLEWYLRPPPGRSWFTMFPWAGLLVAGTIVGDLLDRARDGAGERRMLAGLAIGGGTLLAVSLAGSYLPSIYDNTYFWTTSPSYFFLRIGLMTLLLPVCWLWCRRLAPDRFSPMLQFGHTSLFIYWIHVEMVYGFLTWPIHGALPIGWSFAAFLAFTGLMLWASVAKDRFVSRWRQRRAVAQPTLASHPPAS